MFNHLPEAVLLALYLPDDRALQPLVKLTQPAPSFSPGFQRRDQTSFKIGQSGPDQCQPILYHPAQA
jgi:hypothetical protein